MAEEKNGVYRISGEKAGVSRALIIYESRKRRGSNGIRKAKLESNEEKRYIAARLYITPLCAGCEQKIS